MTLPKMTEAACQQAIVDLAHYYGHWVVHVGRAQLPNGRWITPALIDGKGFPDLFIAGDGGIAFVEVKTDDGKRTTEQLRWEDKLLTSWQEVYVLRPRHLQSGRVKMLMESLRGPTADELGAMGHMHGGW